MTPSAHISAIFDLSIETKRKAQSECLESMCRIAELLAASLKGGGKILFCGNGGSAADAQHLAAELLVRLRPHVNRPPISAIALAMDSSSMTACGNDYSYDEFYARMVEGLGKPGDVLLGITTSGKSPNVCKALEKARSLDIRAVGFLGCGGGPALPLCDEALVVPSSETGRIQEVHITAGHAILEVVEDLLLAHQSTK
ncbi:MAG: SIS domain-containing protein [Verrucomicrobiae bacterium]